MKSNKIAKRLSMEYEKLVSDPICGVKIAKEDGNLYKWKVTLPGPKGSAYEDGLFNLSFDLDNYPFKCPDIKSITPMYHPNIKKDTGEIGMEVFANNWAPTSTISDIIIKIVFLLFIPLIESQFEPEIAQEYEVDYFQWEKNVRDFVKYGK